MKNAKERDVTRAGAMICQLIVDMNLLLAIADKMTAAVKIMFLYSKIISSTFSASFYVDAHLIF